ncbi:MAG: hypothetical protein HKM93_17305, partial [Desulfobacteraceae bacterium]|nr:hypothetical protein [Desulfobacteraceae bacterium]
DLPKPILHQARIGESISMIYAPFYADSKLHDAILNQPITGVLPDDFNVTKASDDRAPGGTLFIPTLCPGCGWDLEGAKDSLALVCTNCETVWKPKHNELTKISTAHLPSDGGKVLFLPFWRIKADVTDIALESYADLIRVANLPKVAQKGWDNIGFRFWEPAFKVRPRFFLRVGSAVTLNQPTRKLQHGFPKKARLHPVTLPIGEALETLKLTLADIMRPRKLMREKLASIQITARAYILVYLPFVEKHHEFVQPEMNLAINKNQLALAKHL